MAGTLRKPRKNSPAGYDTPLKHPDVLQTKGKRLSFIYLFPEFISVSGKTERRAVKNLGPMVKKRVVSFSKVQDVSEEYSFKKVGAIHFSCGERNSIQQGLYSQSPYYIEPNHCEYLFLPDRSTLLLLEIKSLTESVVAAYGFAKSVSFSSSVISFEKSSTKGNANLLAFGVVKVAGASAGRSKSAGKRTDVGGTIDINAHPNLFEKGFKPRLKDEMKVFLSKNQGLKRILDGNLAFIQDDEGSYRGSCTMSYEFLRTSTHIVYGGARIPVSESVSVGLSAQKKKSEMDVERLQIAITFEDVDTLKAKCLDLVERGIERIESPAHRTFVNRFKEFFAEKKRRGVGPKHKFIRADNICATLIGPKASGKSSTMHTMRLAFTQHMDISARWFKKPPTGIEIRSRRPKKSEDGTQSEGVVEVEVYSRGNCRLVLQDTIGLIPTDSTEEVEEYYKTWFERIDQAKYSSTLVPDMILYVLNGQEVSKVATGTANKVLKDKVKEDIKQARHFLRLMHVSYANDIKLPFVFLLTKADLVREKGHQQAAIKYLKNELRVKNIPVAFIGNLQYDYLSKAKVEELQENNNMYDGYKRFVEDAYESVLSALGRATVLAKEHVRRRSQQDYEIEGGGSCTIQ